MKCKNYYCDYAHGLFSIYEDGDVIFLPAVSDSDEEIYFGSAQSCEFVDEEDVEEDNDIDEEHTGHEEYEDEDYKEDDMNKNE